MDLKMKNKWLNIFAINLYLIPIVPYLTMLVILPWGKYLSSVCVILFFILAAINIALAVKALIISVIKMLNGTFTTDCKDISLKAIMKYKIAFAPYLIINFLFWSALVPGSFNPWMLWFVGFSVVLFFFFGVAFTYIAILTTSIYEIEQIIILWRSGTISFKQCLVHIILQLLFVTDVLDAIFLYIRYEKNKAPVNGASQCSSFIAE